VADSPDLAENDHPGLVSSANCTGRTWALRGMHLGARFGDTGAREGRTAAARDRSASVRDCAREKVGRRGKRGRRCSLPQRGAPAALARWREAADRWRIGQPSCSGGGLARLGLARRGRPLRVDEIDSAGRQLYRGGRRGLDVRARGAARAEMALCRGRTRGRARV
jgi:hypothetical protein